MSINSQTLHCRSWAEGYYNATTHTLDKWKLQDLLFSAARDQYEKVNKATIPYLGQLEYHEGYLQGLKDSSDDTAKKEIKETYDRQAESIYNMCKREAETSNKKFTHQAVKLNW